jgi:hypothetical protein
MTIECLRDLTAGVMLANVLSRMGLVYIETLRENAHEHDLLWNLCGWQIVRDTLHVFVRKGRSANIWTIRKELTGSQTATTHIHPELQ